MCQPREESEKFKQKPSAKSNNVADNNKSNNEGGNIWFAMPELPVGYIIHVWFFCHFAQEFGRNCREYSTSNHVKRPKISNMNWKRVRNYREAIRKYHVPMDS